MNTDIFQPRPICLLACLDITLIYFLSRGRPACYDTYHLTSLEAELNVKTLACMPICRNS